MTEKIKTPPTKKRPALAAVILFVVVALVVGYVLGWGIRPAGPSTGQQTTMHEQEGHSATPAKKTVYTCSMHPQIRSDKPGKCPLCGMDLIPIEVDAPTAPAPDTMTEMPAAPSKTQPAATVYTCSMHPQIRSDKPGKCPICGMDLIPVAAEPSASGAASAIMGFSPEAKALMQVETAAVERKSAQAVVTMVGRIGYDERRLGYISAWVPGRIDRLFVDYTGVEVDKGAPMVSLYSPELISAQDELIQARKALSALSAESLPIIRETTAATVEAAREKLRLLGMTSEQISKLESSEKTDDHATITAPIGGTVISKDALEGMYVGTGMKIYTIADLSAVWVLLDAYESDLSWLAVGQSVDFEAIAYPGEKFTGQIAFIDPVLNEMTRTAAVRVDALNPGGRLKPGMFVKASAMSTLDNGAAQLLIPASAALVTGKRAVVYIETSGTDRATYEGRVIVLGPRAGDYYVVESGLSEGDRVVTRGAFQIDAAMQIQARPSMMNPTGAPAPSPHAGHSMPMDSGRSPNE